MTSVVVIFRHDVEKEGFHVVVQCLGSKEEFGKQTEVLAVDWVLAAVHFEEGILAVAVDLVARRMFGWTFKLATSVHVLEIQLVYNTLCRHAT